MADTNRNWSGNPLSITRVLEQELRQMGAKWAQDLARFLRQWLRKVRVNWEAAVQWQMQQEA
jgi:hypothetical protein